MNIKYKIHDYGPVDVFKTVDGVTNSISLGPGTSATKDMGFEQDEIDEINFICSQHWDKTEIINKWEKVISELNPDEIYYSDMDSAKKNKTVLIKRKAIKLIQEFYVDFNKLGQFEIDLILGLNPSMGVDMWRVKQIVIKAQKLIDEVNSYIVLDDVLAFDVEKEFIL